MKVSHEDFAKLVSFVTRLGILDQCERDIARQHHLAAAEWRDFQDHLMKTYGSMRIDPQTGEVQE